MKKTRKITIDGRAIRLPTATANIVCTTEERKTAM